MRTNQPLKTGLGTPWAELGRSLGRPWAISAQALGQNCFWAPWAFCPSLELPRFEAWAWGLGQNTLGTISAQATESLAWALAPYGERGLLPKPPSPQGPGLKKPPGSEGQNHGA